MRSRTSAIEGEDLGLCDFGSRSSTILMRSSCRIMRFGNMRVKFGTTSGLGVSDGWPDEMSSSVPGMGTPLPSRRVVS